MGSEREARQRGAHTDTQTTTTGSYSTTTTTQHCSMGRLHSLVIVLVVATTVKGWGAMFNSRSRYNPSMLSSYDTSGGYYNMLTKSEQGVEEPRARVVEAPIQELFRAEKDGDDDPCRRKCTSNEHCCEGHVCVDTQNSVTGSCLPVSVRRRVKYVTGTMIVRQVTFVWRDTMGGWSVSLLHLGLASLERSVESLVSAIYTPDSAVDCRDGRRCSLRSFAPTSLTQKCALEQCLHHRINALSSTPRERRGRVLILITAISDTDKKCVWTPGTT